jgi:hypothetical protein
MSNTHHATRWVPLAALLWICASAHQSLGGEGASAPAQTTAVLDVPDDAELHAAYQSDRSNQTVQSWAQYRGWVQTFYRGNLMSEGWSRFGQLTAGAVTSPEARQAVIRQINELGRIIAREWAKDSSIARITTSDLRRWNDLMATARQRDDGSGQQIIGALKAVRRLAENRH